MQYICIMHSFHKVINGLFYDTEFAEMLLYKLKTHSINIALQNVKRTLISSFFKIQVSKCVK